MSLAQALDGAATIEAGLYLVSLALEEQRDGLGRGAVVVDHQDLELTAHVASLPGGG